MTEPTLLAGDLGGTNTRLCIARPGPQGQQILFEQHFKTDAYPQLLPMLQAFLAAAPTPPPTRACIAVAGPVEDTGHGQWARVTRQQWELDGMALRQALNLERLQLINDFEAIGHAIAVLPAEQLHTLQTGAPLAKANRAVIGAGTGLGQALLIPTGDGYRVLPTEGGHVDFAPQGELQQALLGFLERRYPHVSYDRVVSGPGLVAIYHFMGEHLNLPLDIDTADPGAAAAISETAVRGTDPAAQQALALFVTLYGAQAGNLALAALARGGVYIAGGIATKILPTLQHDAFLAAFHAKGRMEALLRNIPVHVVTAPQVGLLGAIQVAQLG